MPIVFAKDLVKEFLIADRRNLENPEACLVISRWESIDDWNRWRNSEQQMAVEEKIEALTAEKTESNIYVPMLADTKHGPASI